MELSPKRQFQFQTLISAGRGICSILSSHSSLLHFSKALRGESLADETLLSLQPGICGFYSGDFLLACGAAPFSEAANTACGANRPAFDADLLSVGFFCDSPWRLDIPQGPRFEDLPGASQRLNFYLAMFLLDVLRSYRGRQVATRWPRRGRLRTQRNKPLERLRQVS